MTTTSRFHWGLTLALATLGASLLVAFTGPRQRLPILARPSEDAKVLRVAYIQRLRPDPHLRTQPLSVHNQFILSLWEPLIECDPETGRPGPAAAESWSWSNDRTVLTLKLRPDGRWSSGEAVTARDFVRAWRRLLRQDGEAAVTLFPLLNAEAYSRGEINDPNQVGVEAVDDLTLRLTLREVRSTMVAELADPLLSPLHETSLELLSGDFAPGRARDLITNGPFAIARASSEGFTLRASPHYHGRNAIKLSGIRFLRTDGPRMALLLIAAGRADMTGVSPAGGEPLRLPTARCVTEAEEMAMLVSCLDLNVTRGPLRDVRVRKALALALNRAKAVKADESDRMVPAFAWVPDMPGRPGLTLLREDADEARRLLAEAGYPGGEGFPVLRMPVPPRWMDSLYLQAWADQWHRELGIRTHFALENDRQLKAHLEFGDYDIYVNGLQATVPDAGDMLSTFSQPGVYNGTRWLNREVVQLLGEANRRTGDERLAILEQVERKVMDQVPTIPTTFERRRTILGVEIGGWYAEPLGRQSLKRLSIDPLPAEEQVYGMSGL